MALVTKYGQGARDPASGLSHRGMFAEARIRQIASLINVANGDSANSLHYYGKVPSDALFVPALCTLYHEAITGLTDYDIGFYINGAEVASGSLDALANGLNLTTGSSKSAVGAVAVGDLTKPAYELAGLTVDPGAEFDLVGTQKVAAGADGVLELLFAFTKE